MRISVRLSEPRRCPWHTEQFQAWYSEREYLMELSRSGGTMLCSGRKPIRIPDSFTTFNKPATRWSTRPLPTLRPMAIGISPSRHAWSTRFLALSTIEPLRILLAINSCPLRPLVQQSNHHLVDVPETLSIMFTLRPSPLVSSISAGNKREKFWQSPTLASNLHDP